MTLSSSRLPSLLILATSALLITGCSNDEPAPQKARTPLTVKVANPHTGKILANQCTSCHGVNGVSATLGVPHLAGQNQTYLRDALIAYKAGKRQHYIMQDIAKDLSEQHMRNLAAWYSDLPVAKNKTLISDTRSRPSHKEATAIMAGRQLANACRNCHGPEGNSSVAGTPNLTGQHPNYLLSAIAHCQIRTDQTLNNLSKTLSGQNLEDISLFYAIQAPQKSTATHRGDADSAAVRAKKCTFCHGKNGNSKKSNVPSLAGQDAAYLSKAIASYVSGERSHEAMNQVVEKLEEEEIDNLAAWFAQQTPEIAPRILIPRSAQQWSKKCDNCHGDNGSGLGNAAPRLAGQREEYLHSSLLAYQQNSRDAGQVHTMAPVLSPREISNLARYYSGMR